jgi:hypothetical protein
LSTTQPSTFVARSLALLHAVRSQVYAATARVMLKDDNDLAVRLAACDAFVSMVENDWAKDWQGLAQVQPLAIEAAGSLLRAPGLGAARQQVCRKIIHFATCNSW